MNTFRTIIISVTDGIIRTFTGTGEAGGTIQGEIIQQVGIKSHPKPGDSGLVLQDGERAYLIATDNDDTPALVEGERAVAFDAENYIKFEVTGGILQKIHVNTQKDVDVQAVGNVTVTGASVTVNSTVVKLGLVLAGFVTLVKSTILVWLAAHTHKESGGGETLAPTQAIGPEHSTVNTSAS